jgi:hypothetical protein
LKPASQTSTSACCLCCGPPRGQACRTACRATRSPPPAGHAQAGIQASCAQGVPSTQAGPHPSPPPFPLKTNPGRLNPPVPRWWIDPLSSSTRLGLSQDLPRGVGSAELANFSTSSRAPLAAPLASRPLTQWHASFWLPLAAQPMAKRGPAQTLHLIITPGAHCHRLTLSSRATGPMVGARPVGSLSLSQGILVVMAPAQPQAGLGKTLHYSPIPALVFLQEWLLLTQQQNSVPGPCHPNLAAHCAVTPQPKAQSVDHPGPAATGDVWYNNTLVFTSKVPMTTWSDAGKSHSARPHCALTQAAPEILSAALTGADKDTPTLDQVNTGNFHWAVESARGPAHPYHVERSRRSGNLWPEVSISISRPSPTTIALQAVPFLFPEVSPGSRMVFELMH